MLLYYIEPAFVIGITAIDRILSVKINAKLLIPDRNFCALGNAFGNERVAPYHDVLSYDGITAENGRSRVDGNVVKNGRVTLYGLKLLTALGGERSERYSLINLDIISDLRGLAYYYAGAVSMKKYFPIVAPG